MFPKEYRFRRAWLLRAIRHARAQGLPRKLRFYRLDLWLLRQRYYN